MIRLAAYDGCGTIYLLDHKKPHKLVRKSHSGKGDHGIGTVVYRFAETIWATYKEDEVCGEPDALAAYKIGKAARSVFVAPFIEQNEVVGRCDFGKEALTLEFFLLFLRHAFSGADIRDTLHGEREIMTYARGISTDSGVNGAVAHGSHTHQFHLHGTKLRKKAQSDVPDGDLNESGEPTIWHGDAFVIE